MTWSSSNIICPRTAGFGYRFASLASATKRLVDADNRAATTADGDSDGDSELAAAFGVIFSTARRFRVMTVLQVWFPLLRRFVSRGRLYHPVALRRRCVPGRFMDDLWRVFVDSRSAWDRSCWWCLSDLPCSMSFRCDVAIY